MEVTSIKGFYQELFSNIEIDRYYPEDSNQRGYFCVFTSEFVSKSNTGILINDLPIFSPSSNFVYHINEEQYHGAVKIFQKMQYELSSDSQYKYDLLRNFPFEIIHFGQKLQPIDPSDKGINASSRIATLFVELLERQFSSESTSENIQVKSANEFAVLLNIQKVHTLSDRYNYALRTY